MRISDWSSDVCSSDLNNWLVLHEAARTGAGLAVLPCYLGDGDPALRRVGRALEEVAADQWLLVHRDLRALPRVRAVMDALIQLFQRSEEHTSELQSLMRISYAVFCLKKNKNNKH